MPIATEPVTFEQWETEAISRFGTDPKGWTFVCPSCGNRQTMGQFKAIGDIDPNLAYFNCIGRHDGIHGEVSMGTKPGPCNYTGGGLFNLNPVAVAHPETGKVLHIFAFADPLAGDAAQG